MATRRRKPAAPAQLSADDPLWFKNAIVYELHVRAFQDSNGDGIGDFRGLTQRLDYLQDLGVTAIWLLPFYPSPLRDDGYDIADYTGVNEAYGTLQDVRRFIREAHARGLRVITELVLNHTSDQHRWFQRARRAPAGSRHRDFYVWSDSPEKYEGTRIIFQDFESSNWTWDPVAKAYYWHRFYSHQPDLNFENPAVHEALRKVVDLWFEAGVDGMRLDAVPYLYEREGTSCENLPETHVFLKQLRAHVEERYPGAMFLAEANQWPEDAVAYFGDGDECQMCFHFPLMPRLFMSLRMEDRFPIIDILNQTPAIPDNCQWALFLRNHDELTLEMVTDEERDYMYRVYAGDRQARINLGIRRRLAPLLENNRRKIELLNALLLSLPGTPVIYYGDEIGMGDNIYLGDRDGVRTPMQWSSDRNAGFSRSNPQRLFLPPIIDPEYHYEALNVEAQQNNSSSLLWWMKRLIALRKRYTVFGSGAMTFVNPENPRVIAFVRHDQNQRVLIVANLSRFSQAAELDLSRFRGMVPVEMFGHSDFPPIGDLPYFITLGPHSLYWFSLEPVPVATAPVGQPPRAAEQPVPEIEVAEDPFRWFTSEDGTAEIEGLLATYIPARRWFRSKARDIRSLRIVERIGMAPEDGGTVQSMIALVDFDFTEGEPASYAVPLALAGGGHTAFVFGSESPAIIARVRRAGSEETLTLYDAMVDPAFCSALLEMMLRRRRAKGERGRLVGLSTRTGREIAERNGALDVHIPRAEQTNSSVIFGEQLILKLFRGIAPGINPDHEISRHLSHDVGFAHTPPFAGALEYEGPGGEPFTVALLQGFVPNEGDGWRYTLRELGSTYEAIAERLSSGEAQAPETMREPLLALAGREAPELASELFGRYLHSAELLGRRTAEMHLALARGNDKPAFAPQAFTLMHQRSLYQSLRNSAQRSLKLLRERLDRLPEEARADANRLLERESELMSRLGEVSRRRLSGERIRCHGDFHLGQVLWTGRDFLIIDFEGEPARALSERRLKWTPLRDVAGMLRSFQYAAWTALRELVERGSIEAADLPRYEPWASFWQTWVGAVYLGTYLRVVREGRPQLLPADDEGVRSLLEAWVLEKAMYEVAYELNNRPGWVAIPLHGALEVLDAAGAAVTTGPQ